MLPHLGPLHKGKHTPAWKNPKKGCTTSNYDYRSNVTAMLDQLGWRTSSKDEQMRVYVSFIKLTIGLWQYLSQTTYNPHTECPGSKTQWRFTRTEICGLSCFWYTLTTFRTTCHRRYAYLLMTQPCIWHSRVPKSRRLGRWNSAKNDMDTLSMWESQWDMEFNPSKCQVVRVTTARKAINTVYRLHGQVLEVVTSAKYLGLVSPVAYPGTPT